MRGSEDSRTSAHHRHSTSQHSFPRYARLVDAKKRKDPAGVHRRILAERLSDPASRAEYERMCAEMREQLAPASRGPIINPGRRRSGRLIFDDANE